MSHQTIDGITYTDHALARMASRGIPASVVAVAVRTPNPRWSQGHRWLYRITARYASVPELRPWVGVCVLWDAADQVVVTVYWDRSEPRPRPCTRRHKVYVRRGPKRGWVYPPTTKAGGRA